MIRSYRTGSQLSSVFCGKLRGATGNCLPKRLQAFPQSTQADTAISNVSILCTNAWKLGAACGRLLR